MVTKQYRHGFQGYEGDPELKGVGNSYTTEFRQYDPRLGRWLTTDPIVHEYQSPYCGFDDNPILYTDPDGTTVNGDYYDIKTGKKLGTDGINDGKTFEITKSQWNKLSVDAAGNMGDQSFQNASYAYGSKQVYGSEANAYIFGSKTKAYESKIAQNKAQQQSKEMVRPQNVPKQAPATKPQIAPIPPQQPSDQLGPGGTNTLSAPQTAAPSANPTPDENIDFTVGTVGGIMGLSGMPISYLKPFGYLGSSQGSSVASYTLSKVLPYSSPAIKTFTRAIPSVIRGGGSTAVLGRATGRFVPVLGQALLIYDVCRLWAPACQEGIGTYNKSHPPFQQGEEIFHICFKQGTLITSANGLIPIEEISIGDSVLTYNLVTNTKELKPVLATLKSEADSYYELVSSTGEIIFVTAEHPFYVEGKGWIKVRELNNGDRFLSVENEIVTLKSIKLISESSFVYNIEVDGNHNYFVSKDVILVHNKKIQPSGKIYHEIKLDSTKP